MVKETKIKKSSNAQDFDNNNNQNKKEKKKNLKKEKKINPSDVNIIALDIDGNHFRFLADFYAERWVEPGSNSVYLKNEDKKFLIPMPENIENTLELSTAEISSKLVELESEIKEELENDSEEINEKNLIDDYMNYKKKLRTALYSKSSGFWGSNKGNSLLFVARKGTQWFPLKLDTDTSTIHTISNSRHTITRTLESNKRTKYGALNNLTTLGLVFIVATFLMFVGGMYSWYKAFSVQNDIMEGSTYMELVRECKDGITQSGDVIKKSVIDGVAQSLINEREKTDPKGSGG